MGHAVHVDCNILLQCMVLFFCGLAWLGFGADLKNFEQFLQKQKHLKSFRLTLYPYSSLPKEV